MAHPPHILILDDHREIRDALVKHLDAGRRWSVGLPSLGRAGWHPDFAADCLGRRNRPYHWADHHRMGGRLQPCCRCKGASMNRRFAFLRRLFPQSLGGQLLAMLLLALAITQGLGLLLLTDERNRAVRAALGLEAAGRAANVVLLLDDAPSGLRPSILRSADSPLVRFAVGSQPEAPHDSSDADFVISQIRQILDDPAREVRSVVDAIAIAPPSDARGHARCNAPDARGDDGRAHRPHRDDAVDPSGRGRMDERAHDVPPPRTSVPCVTLSTTRSPMEASQT